MRVEIDEIRAGIKWPILIGWNICSVVWACRKYCESILSTNDYRYDQFDSDVMMSSFQPFWCLCVLGKGGGECLCFRFLFLADCWNWFPHCKDVMNVGRVHTGTGCIELDMRKMKRYGIVHCCFCNGFEVYSCLLPCCYR